MKLYIKQKVFSWGDKFSIYDENDKVWFSVEGEIFSLGKKLHLYDAQGEEIAYIHQKVLSFLPRFFIDRGGEEEIEVVKKLTFFHPEYEVEAMNWKITGDFFSHEFEIKEYDNDPVAYVRKKWFSWGDSYELEFMPGVDVQMALCVILIIDAIIQDEEAASTSN